MTFEFIVPLAKVMALFLELIRIPRNDHALMKNKFPLMNKELT